MTSKSVFVFCFSLFFFLVGGQTDLTADVTNMFKLMAQVNF